MAQFNVRNSPISPHESDPASTPSEAQRSNGLTGPRLVGGTSFSGKEALDPLQVQILAKACMQGQEAARQVIHGWQRQGQSLTDIYLQGVAPCARLLGQWWSEDCLDFAMTTIGATRLQQLLHDFSAEFLQESPKPRNSWSLLLMTEPQAQHSMGLFMLSEFFKQAGWNVTLAVPQDVAEFKRVFHSDWFDAVGISVSSDRHIETLAHLLPQLKQSADNLKTLLFLGGPMALLDPGCLKGIAAEVVAEEAPATVSWLTKKMRLGGS